MKTSPLIACSIVCVATLAAAAQAAESAPPARVSLALAVDAAWERAVEGRQADGESRRAQAGKTAARSLTPEPLALELAQREGRWYGDAEERETEIGVSVPLWMPGQRRAHNAQADSDLAWAQANQATTRLELAGRVREAAWTLAERQADYDLARSQSQTLERIAADVARRVRSGDLARTDDMAARGELLVAQVQLAGAQQQLQAGRSEWRLLTGLDALPDPVESLPPAAADAGMPAHPQLLRAEQDAERARLRLDVVRQSRREAPELTFSVRDERPEANVDSIRSLGVAVRVPLGSRGRNAPLQAEAESEVAVAETALRLQRERQGAELALARDAATAAEGQLQAATQRATLLRERAGLLETSFNAGQIGLVDLLRANDDAAQAEADLNRQQAAHGLTLARLLQANGTLP